MKNEDFLKAIKSIEIQPEIKMDKEVFFKAIDAIETQRELDNKRREALSIVFVDEGGFPAQISHDHMRLELALINVLASVFNDKGNEETDDCSFIETYLNPEFYMIENRLDELIFKGDGKMYYKIRDKEELWGFLTYNRSRTN